MIKVSQARFAYGDRGFQLHATDLDVPRGETVAVIGSSGTGKTTLLNLIAGILLPRSGSIRVDSTELSGLTDPDRRRFRIRRMGLVFQEFELLEYLSVMDNMVLPYRLSNELRLNRDVGERAGVLAEQVGIGDKLHRYPAQLSQGERQRVAVCRALLPNPSVILADEPTGNLDPANRDQVLELMFDYVRSNSATLIAVTHEHEVLDRFDRVLDIANLQEGAAS